MPIKQAPIIVLSFKQRKILEAMRKGTHSPWHWIQRSTIILMAADGLNNKEIARQTSWNRNTVKLWRIRFAAVMEELHQIEITKAHLLKSKIEAALSDELRPGRHAELRMSKWRRLLRSPVNNRKNSDYLVVIGRLALSLANRLPVALSLRSPYGRSGGF